MRYHDTTEHWRWGLMAVDFDLELGPVVQGIYPPMWLDSSESENMYVNAYMKITIWWSLLLNL